MRPRNIKSQGKGEGQREDSEISILSTTNSRSVGRSVCRIVGRSNKFPCGAISSIASRADKCHNIFGRFY